MVGTEIALQCSSFTYTLDKGLPLRHTIEPVLSETNRRCQIHGADCLGHIERVGANTFLPVFMTKSSDDRQHPLMRLKSMCLSNRCTIDDYRSEVVKYMRSKTGYLRNMNSIVVEGSLKMVISPTSHSLDSIVYIPQHIAESTKVPDIINGVVTESCVNDGDYGILVRQPVLWHGGIRPCKIRVIPYEANTSKKWDSNCSMKLPISMCSTFGADFDGDEMSLFPVKSKKAIDECKASLWDNEMDSPYSHSGYGSLVGSRHYGTQSKSNAMALASTICWTDRLKGYKATRHHAKWMTSSSSVIKMKERSVCARDFALRAMKSMSSSCTKSSLQSDIGATSRRSKLGAERIYLDSNRCVRCQNGNYSTLIPRESVHVPNVLDGYFGNPTVRAVSKLCRASMQITLKVKSSSSVSDTSPTLSLLSGGSNWLCIMKSGSIDVVNKYHRLDHSKMEVTCSLYDISKSPEFVRHGLVQAFIRIVCKESRCQLDPAEYQCLFYLIIFICGTKPSAESGIESNISKFYGEFSTIPRWNMCYVDEKYITYCGLSKTSSTLVEHMMLGNTRGMSSICQ